MTENSHWLRSLPNGKPFAVAPPPNQAHWAEFDLPNEFGLPPTGSLIEISGPGSIWLGHSLGSSRAGSLTVEITEIVDLAILGAIRTRWNEA
jgi:hypothetical protein